jgi:hypothetical protein
MEKNLVVRQTKNVQQMHLFVVCQPKNARQRLFNKIQHLHRKHQNYQMASKNTKILHKTTYVVYCQ